MKRILLFALVMSLFCAPASLAAETKPVVGLVMKSLANEFFKTMEEGAVKYAQEDGSLL